MQISYIVKYIQSQITYLQLNNTQCYNNNNNNNNKIIDATSYGSSRRKTYGGKDWRILGVNARISHPRLGVKIVPIHPELADAKEAAEHINEVWSNPLSWWNSPELLNQYKLLDDLKLNIDDHIELKELTKKNKIKSYFINLVNKNYEIYLSEKYPKI